MAVGSTRRIWDILCSDHPTVFRSYPWTWCPMVPASWLGIFLFTILIVVCLSIAWYIWYTLSFKILPWFFPSEAPPYPYIVPVLGHAYRYFRNSHRLIAEARAYFSGSRKPFTIVLAGQRYYVLTSPQDAHLLYSRPSVFNFDFWLSKALSGFGVNPSKLDKFWQKRPPSKANPAGKCIVHVTEDIYKRYLLPGPHLSSLLKIHKVSLITRLSFGQIYSRWGSDPISLYELCTTTMIDSMQLCLLDPIIRTIEPNITRDMMEFTDDMWKLMHPTLFVDSTRPRRTLRKYLDSFQKYQSLPQHMRAQESSLFGNLINQYREYGIDGEDGAAVLVMVYWAAVSNVAKLPYWMIVNVLFDNELLSRLREEVSPAMHETEVDSNYLLNQCPLLRSVFLETLRLTKMDHVYRKLEADVEIGGLMLRKGGNVILSVTELHRDGEAFGLDPPDFHPARFLDQSELANSRSFRPFGSGLTHCPGREFALQQSLLFVALILHGIDIQVMGRKTMPQIDQNLLTVGLSRPLPGTDVLVSLQPRHTVSRQV